MGSSSKTSSKMTLLQPRYMTGYTPFLLFFLADMAKAEFSRPVNHAVVWPCLIGGVFGGLLLMCCLSWCLSEFCEKCCGVTCDGDEQGSVPRSEYLAMQKRMEKLEQKCTP